MECGSLRYDAGKQQGRRVGNTLRMFDFIFSNINLQTPFDFEREPNQLHYTYLDTFGRPVIIAHKTNLVEQHIQDFEVITFSKI